jgi:hypothetical protein
MFVSSRVNFHAAAARGGLAWPAWRGGIDANRCEGTSKAPDCKVCAHERRMTSAQKFAPSAEGDVDMSRRMSLRRLFVAQGAHARHCARGRVCTGTGCSRRASRRRQCAHRSGICETMVQVFASMPCENGGTMICRNAANMHRATANIHRATANMHRATANMHRATANMQRATANMQQTTCNGQRQTNGRRSAIRQPRYGCRARGRNGCVLTQAASLTAGHGIRWPLAADECDRWPRMKALAADEGGRWPRIRCTPRLFPCCTSCAVRRGPAASERSRNGSGAAVASASRNDCAAQCVARGCGAEQTDPNAPTVA